jgi:hypothetical protein
MTAAKPQTYPPCGFSRASGRLPTPPDLPAPSRQSRLEPNKPSPKPCEVEFLNIARTAIDHTLATVQQTPADRRIAGRARNVAQGAHESQADRGIRDRIVANLLESQVEQAVEIDPGNDDAENVWRIVVIAPRRITARPPDNDGAQLIDRADRGRRIVDRRGNRPQGDVDDLHDAELDVLLHRASRAEFDRSEELKRAVL